MARGCRSITRSRDQVVLVTGRGGWGWLGWELNWHGGEERGFDSNWGQES